MKVKHRDFKPRLGNGMFFGCQNQAAFRPRRVWFAAKQEVLKVLEKCTYVDCATRAFSSKPRGEKGGRVEVMLKVADYLG